MRIISKFRDYYDGVQSYGVDDRVFIRKTINHLIPLDSRLIDLNENLEVYNRSYIPVDGAINCSSGVLCVANKHHFYLKLLYENKFHYIFNVEMYNSFLNKVSAGKFDGGIQKILTNKNKHYFGVSRWSSKSIENYFKVQTPDLLFEYHHIYNTPIFSYSVDVITDMDIHKRKRMIKIISNPKLYDMNFAKIADPFQMYQDIDMFNSGVLSSQENNIVEISDIDLRDGKGFDKMSFKKYPTKHK